MLRSAYALFVEQQPLVSVNALFPLGGKPLSVSFVAIPCEIDWLNLIVPC